MDMCYCNYLETSEEKSTCSAQNSSPTQQFCLTQQSSSTQEFISTQKFSSTRFSSTQQFSSIQPLSSIQSMSSMHQLSSQQPSSTQQSTSITQSSGPTQQLSIIATQEVKFNYLILQQLNYECKYFPILQMKLVHLKPQEIIDAEPLHADNKNEKLTYTTLENISTDETNKPNTERNKLNNESHKLNNKTYKFNDKVHKFSKEWEWNDKYKCEACGFKAMKLSTLRSHSIGHKPRSVCSKCMKSVRPDNLSKHMKTHDQERVECNQCGRSYKNLESLRSHRSMHTKAISICQTCNKVFWYKGAYMRHLKSHKVEVRNQQCEICGKTYVNKRDLLHHIMSHSGERPHACPYCPMELSSPWSLKTHIKRHTNERSYICEKCGQTFLQKVSLVSHLKSRHQIDVL